MIGMWYVEAGKYNVLPIDARGTLRLAEQRPQIAVDRKKYVYYPGTQMVPSNAAPHLVNVPHSVSVHANVPKGGAEGVLYSMGGNDGGFSFYVQGGKLTYGYNYVADRRFKVQSDNGGIPEGDHIFSFEFTPTGKPDIARGKGVPAKIKLFLDGKPIGSGELPVTIPLSLGLAAGVSVGTDAGSPVMTDYTPPFAFTGTVKKVLVDVSGEAIEDKEAKMRMYLARQ
jgi:arylsulfatase